MVCFFFYDKLTELDLINMINKLIVYQLTITRRIIQLYYGENNYIQYDNGRCVIEN
jgi:hypothetical protein